MIYKLICKNQGGVSALFRAGVGGQSYSHQMVEKLNFAHHQNVHMIKFINACMDKILLWVE